MTIRGFTLVEVLVALVIVSVALFALMSATGHYTRQAFEHRDRTLAHWIAADRLAAYRLDAAFPAPGRERGETMQAGERWVWTVVISEAPGEPDLRRVDVVVAHATRPDAPVHALTGFVGRRWQDAAR